MNSKLRLLAMVLGLAAVAGLWAAGGGSESRAAAPSPFAPIMDFGTGCLLGGAQDKKFVVDQDAFPKVKGGEVYRIYSLKGLQGRATGGKPESIGIPCEDVMEVKTKPSYDRKDVIGLGGTWAGMPRVPISVSPNTAVYRQALADLLKARGLANPHILIDQIYRIDLEGDKVDEVIISASYFKNGYVPQPTGGPSPNADSGDYSILFMRKVVRGKVETVVLSENVYKEYAEFIAPSMFRIRGIADLNGDGKMEILMYGMYYEGHWTSVFEINGTQFKEVLACGCGV